MYILNAFSLNMVKTFPATIEVEEISLSKAQTLLANEFVSAVGHPDTATVISTTLGISVPMNRLTVALDVGDSAVVAQYVGPRLPEGCTELPESATIKWFYLKVK